MANAKSAFGVWNTSATRHSWVEDVQGILTGSLISSLGLFCLSSAGLLTGSTAGIAFLLHYAIGVNFGLAFFVVNLPFFYLSLKQLGPVFTVKTFIAITLTSLLTNLQPLLFDVAHINALWSAVLGGILLGFGLLALSRVPLLETFGLTVGPGAMLALAFAAILAPRAAATIGHGERGGRA